MLGRFGLVVLLSCNSCCLRDGTGATSVSVSVSVSSSPPSWPPHAWTRYYYGVIGFQHQQRRSPRARRVPPDAATVSRRSCCIDGRASSDDAAGLSTGDHGSNSREKEDAVDDDDYDDNDDDDEDGRRTEIAPGPPPPPPPYDGAALAHAVFADNPLSFYTNQQAANANKAARRKILGRRKTVDHIRGEYMSKYPNSRSFSSSSWFQKLAEDIGARTTSVQRYYEAFAANVKIEQLLDEREILALDGSDEVEEFRRLRVLGGVPTGARLYHDLRSSAASRPRDYRLCYVLGPSGSGKTFFALQHVRHFCNDDDNGQQLPSALLYIRPAEFSEQVDMARPEAPHEMVQILRQRLQERIRSALRRVWDPAAQPLDMHLSLVLDEAGNTSLRSFFDDRQRMVCLMDELALAQLARSFVVVVVGTNVQGHAFDSTNEVHVVRMRPWTRDDLVAVLAKNRRRLRSGSDKDPTMALADAVCAIPLLNALTSNGRTTCFLIETIVEALLSDRRTSSEEETSWLALLSERRSAIAEVVVRRYSHSNALATLEDGPSQRMRVGAWILGALSRLNVDDATTPLQLDGLCRRERSIAALLYQEYILKSGTGLVLAPKQRFSTSLTPALAIVLFDLLGVLSFVLAGSNGGAEEAAVLYAARQWVLRCWTKHAGQINRLQKQYDPDRDRKSLIEFESGLGSARTRYELDRDVLEATFGLSLKQLRLYRLPRQIQSPETTAVRIPMVPKDSILVNAEKASFADVIAPYTFIQARYSTAPRKMMMLDLPAELRKCSLLRECDDTRVLRGLVAVWQGTLPANTSEDDDVEHGLELEPAQLNDDSVDSCEPWWKQQSKSYPENLITYSAPFDGVSYVRISVNSTLALPTLPGERKIAFLLSTNVRRINASLSDSDHVLLTEDSLNEFNEVDATKLTNSAPWTKFLETVREHVSVQFLFTRCD
jgi:hypothetical protein